MSPSWSRLRELTERLFRKPFRYADPGAAERDRYLQLPAI
jgi:hypothetical protein